MAPRIKEARIDLNSPDTCVVTVDPPVLPRGFAVFRSSQEAAGSPLARRLFELDGILGVRLCGATVTLRKRGFEDWRTSVVRAAAVLDEHARSGDEAVAPEFRDNLLPDDAVRARLREVVSVKVNPGLASHGGFAEIVDVRENRVYLRMGGGCQGCASSAATLRQGIESELRLEIPQLEAIIDVTDHDQGASPYFKR